jgi:hypothetical protein
MTRIAALAASLVIVAAPPAAGARDGEVKAVSVTPAVGKVEVVIDLQGAAEVREFTLTGPYRLVVDLVGARLAGPAVRYDGENRGGVRNVRYSQYQPDVVRDRFGPDRLRDHRGAGPRASLPPTGRSPRTSDGRGPRRPPRPIEHTAAASQTPWTPREAVDTHRARRPRSRRPPASR